MSIEAIVTSAVAILSPYVVAGATKAAEVTGEAVATGAGKLLTSVRTWFAGNEEASSALQQFERNPSRYAPIVEELLLEVAKGDPEVAKDLGKLVEQIGPRAEVIQKIRSLAGQATGLDLAKWEQGVARAYQEVDTVEAGGTLVGIKIGK